MNFSIKRLLSLLIIISSRVGFAQPADDAHALVQQAVQFNKDGKYAEAIEKYSAALKIDSNNIYANYGIAYSLLASGKGKEGIPNLEKVIRSKSNLIAEADDLLGNIYDKDHESAKAIDAYNAAIKADAKYQHAYYNLGLVYFRDKKYAEAEKYAIDAIKLDPKHANSQRMYALVTFHQNKRAAAFLGFCSFILLEPQTARSAEALGNMQHILQGGVLKPAPGETAPQATDANTVALNQAITRAVAETGKKKYDSPADLLTAQLTAILNALGLLAEKQTGDDFFRKHYAAYFYKLAQSQNMEAFSRLIGAGANKDEYTKWANEHSKEVADLDRWIAATERGF